MSRVRSLEGGAVRLERSARGIVLSLREHEAWLETHGYLRPEGPEEHPARRVFHESPRRENAVREDGPDGVRLYDKRALSLGLGKRVRTWLRGRTGGSLCLHEWRVLRHARRAGLRVPEPWAAGERRDHGIPRSAFLLTRELPGRSLADMGHELAAAAPDRRRAIVEAVAREVAALHRAGIAFGALWAKHVLVDETAGGLRVGFLDLATARLHRGLPSWRARVRDLGTLAGSVPRGVISLPSRRRFLTTYLEILAADTPARRLWTPLVRAARRVLLNRRQRPCAALEPPCETDEELRQEDSGWRARRAATAFGLLATQHDRAPDRPVEPAALSAFMDRLLDAGIVPTRALSRHIVLASGGLRLMPDAPVEIPRSPSAPDICRAVDALIETVEELIPDDAQRGTLRDHLEREGEERLLLRRPRGILGA